MTMTDPSAAIRLTTSPQGLPGECAQCRGTLDSVESHAGRTAFVDTGRHQEFYGNVYYCNLCVVEMATCLGMVTPVAVEKMRLDLEASRAESFQLRTLLSEYETKFRGFVDAGFCPDSSAHGDSRALHPSSRAASPALTLVDDAGDEPHEGEDRVGAGEGTAPESLHDEGVGELRADAGSDAADFSLDLS